MRANIKGGLQNVGPDERLILGRKQTCQYAGFLLLLRANGGTLI